MTPWLPSSHPDRELDLSVCPSQHLSNSLHSPFDLHTFVTKRYFRFIFFLLVLTACFWVIFSHQTLAVLCLVCSSTDNLIFFNSTTFFSFNLRQLFENRSNLEAFEQIRVTRVTDDYSNVLLVSRFVRKIGKPCNRSRGVIFIEADSSVLPRSGYSTAGSNSVLESNYILRL